MKAPTLGVVAVAGAVVVMVLGIGLLPRYIQRGSASVGAEPSATPSATPIESPEPTPNTSPDPAVSATPLPPATVTPTVSLPPRVPTASPAYLTEQLIAAARRVLPEGSFSSMPVAFGEGTREMPPLEVVDNGHGYYVAFAHVLDTLGKGEFVLAIWPGTASWKAPRPGCEPVYDPMLSCETSIGPNGEQITMQSGRWAQLDVTENKVKVHLLDGTILSATSNNITEDSNFVPQRPTPPFTTDQLRDLLLTPGMTLYV